MSDDKKKVVLLPCPHCGGRAALSTYKKRIGTVCKHLVIRQHAVCKVCGAQTRVFKALDRAPRAWNKRQTIQSDVLRDALEDLLHAVCGEKGFAEAVRRDSGRIYPWPALELAEAKARKALGRSK